MVYIHSGVLFSYKRWNFAICSNINVPYGHYTKWNRERQMLYDSYLCVEYIKQNQKKKKQNSKLQRKDWELLEVRVGGGRNEWKGSKGADSHF